jgi:hypothetical protein
MDCLLSWCVLIPPLRHPGCTDLAIMSLAFQQEYEKLLERQRAKADVRKKKLGAVGIGDASQPGGGGKAGAVTSVKLKPKKLKWATGDDDKAASDSVT